MAAAAAAAAAAAVRPAPIGRLHGDRAEAFLFFVCLIECHSQEGAFVSARLKWNKQRTIQTGSLHGNQVSKQKRLLVVFSFFFFPFSKRQDMISDSLHIHDLNMTDLFNINISCI